MAPHVNQRICSACIAGQLAKHTACTETNEARKSGYLSYSDYLMYMRRKLGLGGSIYGSRGLAARYGFISTGALDNAEGSTKGAYAFMESCWAREVRKRLNDA